MKRSRQKETATFVSLVRTGPHRPAARLSLGLLLGLALVPVAGPAAARAHPSQAVSPGVNLTRVLTRNGGMPEHQQTDHMVYYNNSPWYFRMLGTSTAAPVVAGTAALPLQRNPNLAPAVKVRPPATTPALHGVAGADAKQRAAYAAGQRTVTGSTGTGMRVRLLRPAGRQPIHRNTVNWNRVNRNTVNWNRVNRNTVNWNTVNWNSGLRRTLKEASRLARRPPRHRP